MTVNIIKGENETRAVVEGKVDSVTSPELEKALMDICDETDMLIIDFEKVPYISSAGLRVLVLASNKISRHGNMKIINVCSDIKEIFEVTGLVDLFDIEGM